MDAMNDIQKIRTQIEQRQAEQEQVFRRTMSVPEMRKLQIFWESLHGLSIFLFLLVKSDERKV